MGRSAGRGFEAFLDVRSATPSNFSPDGSKILVQSNLSGTAQLYVVPTAGGEPQAITDFGNPVAGAYLPASDEIVLTGATAGDERSQLSLMRDDGLGLRPLVQDPEHIHRLGGVRRDGSLLAYASNTRNGEDFDVYVLPLPAGAPRRVFDGGGWCDGRGFSPEGRWLAVTRLGAVSGDTQLLLVDVDTGETLDISQDTDAMFGAPAWLADSSGFFFSTDAGRDRRAIARYDMDARGWDYVIEREGDLGCAMDWPGARLLVETDVDGCTAAELVDPRTLRTLHDVPLPGDGVASFVFSRDGRTLAYSFTSPVESGDVWVYEVGEPSARRLTKSPRAILSGDLAEPERDTVETADGERVAMFVYRPPRSDDPTPVVVYLHGGPESQHLPKFDSLVQFLVARGYAVVAPNVRGSTGYGRRFEHLDDGRKRLDVLRDLEAVHDWIATAPRLDERRVALLGGSYGGYLVLAGLALQPERWAAGVDIVGMSSLVTFLEQTAPWRRSVRESEYGSLAHDRDFLEHASPLTHAGAIRAPVFLVHGANDPRVPLDEARQLHAALGENGVRSELVVYENEGHGLARLDNRVDAYTRAVTFLDEVLRAG